MTDRLILDASAALAFFHREPGHDVVSRFMAQAETLISAVNLAEVLSKHDELQIGAEQTVSAFSLLGIRIEPFATEGAVLTGSLRSRTRSKGLSLGDRACLSLALHHQCPVLTADRAWLPFEASLGIRVIAIR